MRHGYIQRSQLEVLEYVKEPKLLPTSVLTHSQVKKLMRHVPASSSDGYRDRALLELLYTTGARIGELLALDLSDLDIKNHTATVMGKGNKQRVVPIGRTSLRFLESYLTAVRPFFIRVPGEQLAQFIN